MVEKFYSSNPLKYLVATMASTYLNLKCKVYLIHGDLDEDEVHNLYIHPQIKAIVNFLNQRLENILVPIH